MKVNELVEMSQDRDSILYRENLGSRALTHDHPTRERGGGRERERKRPKKEKKMLHIASVGVSGGLWYLGI